MNTSLDLQELRQLIIDRFSKDELKDLCFHLNIDYDDIKGGGRNDKARELVLKMDREGRLPELVQVCIEMRPNIAWPFLARLFIAYKRHSQTDAQLAQYLQQTLTPQGYYVFLDTSMRIGTEWLAEIDREIQSAHFMVVLLSNESAHSEMLQKEVQRAYTYRRQQGHPQILPVLMAYENVIPYAIDIFISGFQYTKWNGKTDDDLVVQEIVSALKGTLPDKPTLTVESKEVNTDGDLHFHQEPISAPLPQTDPRGLKAPGGAIRPNDKLYVRRPADDTLEQSVVEHGTTTTVHAPRQTGKTSLLMRGLHYASQHEIKSIFVDIQTLGGKTLASPDAFLQEIGQIICRVIDIEENVIYHWQDSESPQTKLTYFLEDHVLNTLDAPVVLAIDEADKLLQTDYYQDIFGLLRSWHNRRALSDLWEKLNIVLCISSEPYLLIDDLSQSPFNVGQMVKLDDFTYEQVAHLNAQHGNPVPPERIGDIMKLLNGHPYLTRQLLYKAATKTMTPNFIDEDGPFGSHLRWLFWAVNQEPILQLTLNQIIQEGCSQNDQALQRLVSAGLVKASGEVYICRCDLYRQYFEAKLK